jgi:hypothetical protein
MMNTEFRYTGPLIALIAVEKLTHYLLVKRPVGDKSDFLKQAGYAVDNPRRLEEDIRTQILSQEATPIETTDYGELFEIKGTLVGPNGTALKVKSVWMEEWKTDATKFITLYPDKGETQ